jgi:hypothetical protein
MTDSILDASTSAKAKEDELRRAVANVYAVNDPVGQFFLAVAIFVTRVGCVVCFLGVLAGIGMLLLGRKPYNDWIGVLVVLGGMVTFCLNAAMLIVFRIARNLRRGP